VILTSPQTNLFILAIHIYIFMRYMLCQITYYKFYSVVGELSLRTIQNYAFWRYAAFTDLVWLFLIHFATCDKTAVLRSKLVIRPLMFKIPSLSKYWRSVLYAEQQNISLHHYREHHADEQLSFSYGSDIFIGK
jgi:hypothetical protein